MKQKRSFPNSVAVIFFAVLGNCIGAQIYKARTGKPANALLYKHVDEHNNRSVTLLVWSNFLPALILGLLFRPHRLVSLLTGVLTTAFMGNEVQELVMDRIAANL